MSETGAGGGLQTIFGASGPLAGCLRDFRPRPEQLSMALEIQAALSAHEDLVIEAGTGTGKTLAYLVPLLLSGSRCVISTHTRTLQDQLYHRDLPMLANALGRPARVRLLKGRANYLCRQRLERSLADTAGRQQQSELRQVADWALRTRSGDISELTGIAEDSPIWSQVTSTVDNCLGTQCPCFDECDVVRARQSAREADIVVVNHHLLMADLTMKEEGFSELLPGMEVAVIDEAHQFPEVAQGFLNVSLASAQLLDLGRDSRIAAVDAGMWSSDLDRAIDGLAMLVGEASLAVSAQGNALVWNNAGDAFHEAVDALVDQLGQLSASLSGGAGDSVLLRRCRERGQAAAAALAQMRDADEMEALRWIRVTARGFVANITPLDNAEKIHALLSAQSCAWIFTSATLAVGEDFTHFSHRLGLESARMRQIPSPFDYGRIARLYLPTGLPAPTHPGYTKAVVAAVRPLLKASRGRAFLLFTSHRALREAAEVLAADRELKFPLLVQGNAPRSRLLESFADSDNAILLGTATFWEGVDIRGPGLVIVMIDRLPFASPGDPLLAARLQAIRDQGGNPFRDFQMPQAVLALKQGVGRLIRDYEDYGIVMICDPRLTEKSYGRVFLDSLPPMPIVREFGEAEVFLAERESRN